MALQPKESPQGVNVSGKIQPAVTKYYLKIAKRYRFVQILLILVLILYVFLIISVFGKYITYNNLQYLLRDFDAMAQTGEGDFTTIRYTRQNEQTFAVFKNGIAVAGKETMELYDSTGLLLTGDRAGYNDPMLVPSEKYLLLYDSGGTDYAVYNSLTRVISRKEEHKIVGGDMSDTGAFVLITRSNETKYAIKHFNSALNHAMTIYKDNYVMDAAISRDGKRIVVCSAVPSATDFDCELALYAAGQSDMVKKVILPHTMPLSVIFGDDGFTVLCDNGLYFYDRDGEIIVSHSLSGMTPKHADLGYDHIVIAADENAIGSENRILVFARDGELLLNEMLKERVTGVGAPSDKDGNALAYVLTPKTVLRLTPESTAAKDEDSTTARYAGFAVEEADTGSEDVLAIRTANHGVVVYTATGAYHLFQ